ncbi:MAG TPA: PAS domain S-box protein, partial [Aggregatilineales bacterium]|nr:PAS domain S-box protein [Aggregatilineales bacterium]
MREIIRILLVEDHQGDTRLLREMLNDEPLVEFQLTVKSDIVSGCAQLVSGTFDIVLLDLSLPGSQGLDTISSMVKAARDIPVIVLTSLDDDKQGYEAIKRGAQDYLIKNEMDVKRLSRAIRYAPGRKEALSLEKTGQFARSIVDALPENIAILDQAATIIDVNKHWIEFVQENDAADQNGFAGYNYLDVCNQVHGMDREYAVGFVAGIRAVMAEEKEAFSLVYPCHSPQAKRWFRGKVTRFYEDGQLRIVVAHEDVTDRKLAEDQLRQLSHAVEHSVSLVVITDHERHIEYVNSSFERVTGYTLDEIKGKTPRILHSGYTSAEEYQQLWKTISSGKTWIGELYNRKKNGEFYWESSIITPLRDPENRITHFLKVGEDITGHKQTQKSLEQYNERLEILHQIDRAVLAADSSGDIASAVLNRISRLVSCTWAGLIEFDHQADCGIVLAYFADHRSEQKLLQSYPMQLFRLDEYEAHHYILFDDMHQPQSSFPV